VSIPAIGSVTAALTSTPASSAGSAEHALNLNEGAPGTGEPTSASGLTSSSGEPLAPSGIEATNGVEGAGGIESASGSAGSGFGDALTNAVSSLERTQQSASTASQALASGTLSDPESAVVTVEEAQLAMQLASQIRTKATEAAQEIFQTQV